MTVSGDHPVRICADIRTAVLFCNYSNIPLPNVGGRGPGAGQRPAHELISSTHSPSGLGEGYP